MELSLDTPAELPIPWTSTSDPRVWQLAVDDAASPAMGLAAARGEAPWPSLVVLGHDDDNAYVMLDLERAGTLDIRGDDETAQAILAALAIELATTPWADDLQVTLVGAHASLPGVVNTGRIRHVSALGDILWALAARAEDVQAALSKVGAASIADARGRGIASDSWTPEILLIAQQLNDHDRAMLHELASRVPGVGIAAVTANARVGECVLDLGSGQWSPGRGIMYPAQTGIRPQQLDAGAYAQALAMLAPPVPVAGPAWAELLDDTEIRLDSIPVQPFPDRQTGLLGDGHLGTVIAMPASDFGEVIAFPAPASPLADSEPDPLPDPEPDPEPDPSIWAPPPGLAAAQPVVPVVPAVPVVPDVSAVPAAQDSEVTLTSPARAAKREPLVTALPAVPAAQDSEVTLTSPARAAKREPLVTALPSNGASPTDALGPPVVRVLGPVTVEVDSGLDPGLHEGQSTELIAFLAFNPGAQATAVSKALWPARAVDEMSSRSAISRARRWLGSNADSHEYLPRFWYAAGGQRLDSDDAGYRLEGVSTDWQAFLDLVGQDAAQTPMDSLLEALALVRGQAFEGTRPGRFAWAEALVQEITASVVDVAHEVARRALIAGDLSTARFAAQVGRIADPVDERPWRDTIRVEWASRHTDAVERLIRELMDRLEDLNLELEPETEDLIDEINQLAGRGTPAAARRA
jgi:hypothetical protein